MAGIQTLRFREGRTTITLPGGFPLTCENTMYAPNAPRGLINYRDLRARNIHACTAMQGDEEIIEFVKESRTEGNCHPNASPDGFYKVAIKSLASSPTLDVEEVCMTAWGEAPRRSAIWRKGHQWMLKSPSPICII